jgi:hypothetical protein
MLFTLLSFALFGTHVQEQVLAKENPSIAGSVRDEKGQTVPGATVVGFFWMAAPPQGLKIYL